MAATATATALKVDDVWVRFRLGYAQRTLSSAVQDLFRARGDGDDSFWGLEGVNLEVARGEVLGIIGGNGSGKTTLMRVMSGILKPDRGTVERCGGVVSVFALGTGFNAKLTGRENVYINAAILGLPRQETDRLFDDIVEFSGIGKFIDMPLKNYSSGMRVRLGFAIAANVKGDIVLLDEVLGGVGDAAFRKKTIAKIREFFDEGRTIILVSHSMPTIKELCSRVVWLEQGKVAAVGGADEIIDAYLESVDGAK